MTKKTEEQLVQALREAMEWNWVDDDMPSHVHRQCEQALAAHEAAKSEGVSDYVEQIYQLRIGGKDNEWKEVSESQYDNCMGAENCECRILYSTEKAALVALQAITQRIQQTEAQARDAWISVDDKLPKCSTRPNSFGVPVLIWPHFSGDGHSDAPIAFYGKRISGKPCFYLYGRRLYHVRFWKPLPSGPTDAAIAKQKGESNA